MGRGKVEAAAAVREADFSVRPGRVGKAGEESTREAGPSLSLSFSSTRNGRPIRVRAHSLGKS